MKHYYNGPTDDPLRDADNYDRDNQAWLDSRPKCWACGEPIQDDQLYQFDEKLICEYCMELNHHKFTDNFIV